MKYLGIDYGTKRIGVAISDDGGSFAFPKAIFDTSNVVEEIKTLVTAENIEAIVIGESVATNDTPNALATHVQAFKAKLTIVTGLPIFFVREDFSTVEAHRYQITAGRRDDSAAAIILQRFLDQLDKQQK